jgi:response regulator RpfG family c-di-GMP phosphodiesterase
MGVIYEQHRDEEEANDKEQSLRDRALTFTTPSLGRVLIVEDEPELAEVLEYNLIRYGFEVLVARDGMEACRIIGQEVLDLILLDLLLPLLNGWEICSMLRSHQNSIIASTPVIMLSALGSADDRLKGYDLGADLYLPKPYVMKEVLFKSRKLIEQHRDSARRKITETELLRVNKNLKERVMEQTYELQVTQSTSIEALAILAESYDSDTGNHLERIQRYVECLASEVKKQSSYVDYLGDKVNFVEEVTLASLLHDIGKTAVPQDILTKPGRLTEQEFDIVKTHTSVAGEILRRANQSFFSHFSKDSYLAFARDIALHHHEKWDGTGYPHQLQGKLIPLSARIVALADVYDALRSRRPYKEPWPHTEAVAEIIRCSGSQFDPELVKIFIENAARIEEISSLLMPTYEHASISGKSIYLPL